MKKITIFLGVLGLVVFSPQVFAAGITASPSSGPIDTVVRLDWPGLPTNARTIVISVQNDSGGIRSVTFGSPREGLYVRFPSTLLQYSEAGITTIPVVPGTYRIVVSTDTIKSDNVNFTVTSDTVSSSTTSPVVPPVSETTQYVGNTVTPPSYNPPAPLPSVIFYPQPTTVPTKTPISLTANLYFGQTNEQVRLLQVYLKQRGFLSADATGYYGRMTTQAVRLFQISHRISTTGTVGPLTRAAISQNQ